MLVIVGAVWVQSAMLPGRMITQHILAMRRMDRLADRVAGIADDVGMVKGRLGLPFDDVIQSLAAGRASQGDSQ